MSFGGVSTTDDSMGGSYEGSALPWKLQQPPQSQQRDSEIREPNNHIGSRESPRRAGLASPPREAGNPLTRMMEPEPEPEPAADIAAQLRRSREQLSRIQEQQQQAEDSEVDLDSSGADSVATASPVNGHGGKRDANFKAKLREDNARLQDEIERLRAQLYADPTGGGGDGGPGTPPGAPGDTTAERTADSEQVELAQTPTDLWLAGAESPTESEKAARQQKLDEFKRRKDAEASRRKEKHAERRKSQEAAALAAQKQAGAMTAALSQATQNEAHPSEEEIDVVFGSHVSVDGKILPAARIHPGIEKRRAARAAAKSSVRDSLTVSVAVSLSLSHCLTDSLTLCLCRSGNRSLRLRSWWRTHWL